MTDDRKYSALRQSVIEKLQTHVIIPISFRNGEIQKVVEDLGLANILHITVLPINIHLKLGKVIDNAIEVAPNKTLNGTFNGDVSILAFTIAYGVVDDKGEPIFSEQDAILISSKFVELAYDLAWQVLEVNNFTTKAKQETVGNSEGTEISGSSSEQQVT